MYLGLVVGGSAVLVAVLIPLSFPRYMVKASPRLMIYSSEIKSMQGKLEPPLAARSNTNTQAIFNSLELTEPNSSQGDTNQNLGDMSASNLIWTH